MPTRRRARPSHSLLDRSVVAQADHGSEAWCPCHLSLKLDQAEDRNESPRQGAISLRLEQLVQFEGLDRQVSVTLRLPLENLESVEHKWGVPDDIPSSIWALLSSKHAIRQTSLVFILIFKLNAPGCLIVPSDATVLTPDDDDRSDILAFRHLCEATGLRVYIHAYDVKEIPVAALETLGSLAKRKGMLASRPPDLPRMYKGRGAREATWDIINIPELPPAYSKQPERATSKRAREASPLLTPKRRAIDLPKSTRPGPATSASTTDADTDFSANALSPLPAKVSQAGLAAAAAPAPTAEAAGLVHAALQGMLQDALPHMIEDALAKLLPALLKSTVQDMLPQILHDAIRGTRPSGQPDRASDSPQSGAQQDRAGQHPLAAVVEPVVEKQLPAVVRKIMDEDGTYGDLIYEAQQQIEMVIGEERDGALYQIREERDACVGEVRETGTAVREMLEGSEPSVGGGRDPAVSFPAGGWCWIEG
ncbi:hypothetical protein MPH_06349 [Macrophomina phaseolina MS6]|uniref:Uncharacterized protein n=1 Tax=Macrophomina phaseolina (strain MS6) TaxID=1126212 RepID=K2S1R2_MACPH|nr:hypothetical protein MPH_06349 [Macrophomina phaseolina MS6]